MTCLSRTKVQILTRCLQGAVTEESMLAVLRECSHEVVLDEDLRLFQNSMLGMIEHALDSTIDRCVIVY